MKLRRHRFRGFPVAASVLTGIPLVMCLVGMAIYTSRAVVVHPILALGYVAGFAALAYYAARLLRARAFVVVGVDGVAFEGTRRHDLPRFLPWSEIKEVTRHESGVSILLKNGNTLSIERLEDALTFLRDLKDHLARYEKRGPVEVPAMLLTEAIPDTGYRDAVVPGHVLVRVVEEPSATVEVRAYAAELAVASGEIERVREAMEATAEPDLRRFLEKLVSE